MFGFLTIVFLFISLFNLYRGKSLIGRKGRFNAASRVIRMYMDNTDHPRYENAVFYQLRVTIVMILQLILWGCWVLLGLYSDSYLYVLGMTIFMFTAVAVLNSLKSGEDSEEYKKMTMVYQVIYCIMLLLLFLNSQHWHFYL